jgi:DnaJ-class molecular chaperone
MNAIHLIYGGKVGIPRDGERVCGRCRGYGLLSKRVSNYPGYVMCESCSGSGVKVIKA